MEAYSRRKGPRDNTLIVDLARGQPIAPCKGRRAEDVITWFKSRPQAERERVDVVGVARSQTSCAAIKEVVGEHVQGIARFHVIQQAVSALDEVLRAGHNQLDAEAAQALKKLRKRWLKAANQLDVDELLGRYEWRRRFPQLRDSIDWGQDVRRWFDRKDDQPAREALVKLIERARQSMHEPLQRIAGTLHRWFEPIVRYIGRRSSNGMTEGFNTKIKLIQRMAYGLRHAHNRQKRI
jgi:transposase